MRTGDRELPKVAGDAPENPDSGDHLPHPRGNRGAHRDTGELGDLLTGQKLELEDCAVLLLIETHHHRLTNSHGGGTEITGGPEHGVNHII